MVSIVDTGGRPLRQMGRATHNVAASRGKRSTVMTGRSSGPNSAVNPELPRVRNRARDAVRNSPYIGNALRALVKHEVGTGITCRFQVEDESLQEHLTEAWKESLPNMFSEGIGHFYAGQRLGSRGRNESGEVFLRRRRRPARSMAGVPIQVQMLESDLLDTTYNAELTNNNYIRAGIELNTRGDRVAYHFFKQHPDDLQGTFSSNAQRVRILAKDVVHHYIPMRPGQLRGMPIASPALFKNANLEAYDDYELERKKNHASFTGTIEREARYDTKGVQIDPITGERFDPDMEIPDVNFTAGVITQLGDGEKLQLFDAEKGGEFYADYMRQQLMSISSAFGVPYELVTGDWKEVNDRILRAILNDFQREIEAIQEIYLITQLCQSTLAWWMDAGVLSGRLQLPDYADRRSEYLEVDWRPQGWAYVHPLQDAQAAALRIETDLSTHEKEARKHNVDSDKALQENVAHMARKQELMKENGIETPTETDKEEDTNEVSKTGE